MSEITVKNLNIEFSNQYNATIEELLAEALDQFGLCNEDTQIGDTKVSDLIKSLGDKKLQYKPLERSYSLITKVGTLLLHKGIINAFQLKQALDYQKKTPVKIGEILVKLGFVQEDQMSGIIEEQKKLRKLLNQLFSSNKIEVTIDYKEPHFEKTINRKDINPFSFTQTIPTSDISIAIIDALSNYLTNERLSNVHWRSEITKVKVAIDIKDNNL